jgi:hypothetical protein
MARTAQDARSTTAVTSKINAKNRSPPIAAPWTSGLVPISVNSPPTTNGEEANPIATGMVSVEHALQNVRNASTATAIDPTKEANVTTTDTITNCQPTYCTRNEE